MLKNNHQTEDPAYKIITPDIARSFSITEGLKESYQPDLLIHKPDELSDAIKNWRTKRIGELNLLRQLI